MRTYYKDIAPLIAVLDEISKGKDTKDKMKRSIPSLDGKLTYLKKSGLVNDTFRNLDNRCKFTLSNEGSMILQAYKNKKKAEINLRNTIEQYETIIEKIFSDATAKIKMKEDFGIKNNSLKFY